MNEYPLIVSGKKANIFAIKTGAIIRIGNWWCFFRTYSKESAEKICAHMENRNFSFKELKMGAWETPSGTFWPI